MRNQYVKRSSMQGRAFTSGRMVPYNTRFSSMLPVDKSLSQNGDWLRVFEVPVPILG